MTTPASSFPDIPTGSDAQTRRFLILQHRARAAATELAALDATHSRLLSLLTDIDAETANIYGEKAHKLRDYLPELGSLLTVIDSHSTRALQYRQDNLETRP